MMQALTQPEQFEFVSHQIAVAKQLELESVWKMALYAAIVLLNGEKFLEGERQQRVLERLKKDDCEWSEEF
jgi:proteasome assembly chaperone (PAC2) family protein